MAGSSWQNVPIKTNNSAFPAIVPGADATPPTPSSSKGKDANDFPGALNAGWSDYFQWASKDYSAWQAQFDKAEAARVEESHRWLKYYEDVYNNEMSWWKKITMFALNGIQLWALWKQFQQQRDLADKTYDIAKRVQKIAEELFDFYSHTVQTTKVLVLSLKKICEWRSVNHAKTLLVALALIVPSLQIATHYLGLLSKHSLLVTHVTVHIAMKNSVKIPKTISG